MDWKSFLLKDAIGSAFRKGSGTATAEAEPEDVLDRVSNRPRVEGNAVEITLKLKGAESWLISAAIAKFGEAAIEKKPGSDEYETNQGRFLYVNLTGNKARDFAEELETHQREKIAASHYRG